MALLMLPEVYSCSSPRSEAAITFQIFLSTGDYLIPTLRVRDKLL